MGSNDDPKESAVVGPSSSSSENKKPPAEKAPEERASIFSQLLFSWERPLFRRANELGKKGEPLQLDDLLGLPVIDHSDQVGPQFEESWAKHEDLPTNTKASSLDDLKDKGNLETKRIQKTLIDVIGKRFILAGVIKFFNTALQFSFPLLLNAILKFIEETQAGVIDPDADPWHVVYRGYWLSAILFCCQAGKAILENQYFHLVYRSGYQSRVSVSVAVYNKSLRLTNAERQSTTLGELINLMQVDATKIEMFLPQAHVLWDGMFQILGYIGILYSLIGWPVFVGLFVMVLAGPMQGKVMGQLFGLNRAMVKYTDARVEKTNEALQGIQSVKMYTWEESFAKTIRESRFAELNFLKKVAYLRGFSRAFMGALPGVVAVSSYLVYALATSGDISASTLFAALVAFEQIRFPLLFYPVALAQLAQAKVSAARVQLFLGLKEIGKTESIGEGTFYRDNNAKGEVIVENATAFWDDPNVPIEDTTDKGDDNSSVTLTVAENSTDGGEAEEGALRYPKPTLKNVSMRIAPGELCAVVGRVASGKSSLCSAVLNEMLLESGSVTLKGKVAYAAQSPWILNATLRDNILFGRPMDKNRYDRVLKACQLSHDLDMLEDGDLTEIGERGINLSGGQKQRVSIARAAYADADTIILDDPLSALDPEVAKQLFEECILGEMKGKTIMFVTNQIQFLRFCDTVVALKGGRVLEHGKYTDLIANEKGEVKRLLSESASNQEAAKKKEKVEEESSGEKGGEDSKTAVDSNAPKADAKKLTTKEEQNVGAVSWHVYKKYMQAGGGYLKFTFVFIGFILSVANTISTTAWISFWTSDAGYKLNSEAFYLGIFFMLAITLGLVTFLRAFTLVKFGIQASETLHRDLLTSILRAPQSFFDTTPLGRIISRFSKDLYSIDIELTDFLDMFLYCALSVIASLTTIIFVTPWFGIAVIPLGFVYFRFLNYFREVARSTKRLDSVSRSPVYAQFSETLGGLSTIRAYDEVTRFMGDFENKIDSNTRAYYNNKSADRWLSVRLELIGTCVSGLAAVFACQIVISGAASGIDSDTNFASLAGLSLTTSISITGLLNWCVRCFAQLEAAMNACERVLYYTENIPQEAPYTSEELEETAAKNKDPQTTSDPSSYAVVAAGGKADKFSSTWPEQGAIDLKNLKMRYRQETPLVLKGLNVSIKGGERIGVVGRTGSGKSSLLLTLLRLVEPTLAEDKDSPYSAPISVDGVDILRIGLRELRSRLGIIPQNPVLFSGTIRSNIDPFDEYSDKDIWSALEKCSLKESVEEMPGQLSATVSEYGSNLSSGMRQMLVLGRALLRQCRILLLDEATSSVDFETDKEIQRTLREAFPGCTILTIAHRINTIMDSDKILVMKDGLAAEFDAPEELLKDENSIFSDIVKHSQNKDK